MKYWVNAAIILVMALSSAHACSMFTLVRDGAVLFANNEDYVKPGYVWFDPPAEGKLGRVNFGFKDGFAQGSMNEEGLAFDAAQLGEVPWTPDPAKKDVKNLFELIMDTCGTVDEALALFEEYNCKHLSAGQFMLADATGASAVVTWVPETGLSIVRRESDYQLITNTRIAASGFRCERYVLADRVLQRADGEPVSLAKDALKAMHQEGALAYTSYSNVYDLKARKVHVYNLANYDEVVIFDLAEELAKGKHRSALKDLFAKPGDRRDITKGEQRSFDTRFELPEGALERYAGKYSVNEGKAVIEITVGEEGLLVDAAKGNPAHLFPESETSFRIVEGGQFTFKLNPEGEVTGLTIHRNGDHDGTKLPE